LCFLLEELKCCDWSMTVAKFRALVQIAILKGILILINMRFLVKMVKWCCVFKFLVCLIWMVDGKVWVLMIHITVPIRKHLDLHPVYWWCRWWESIWFSVMWFLFIILPSLLRIAYWLRLKSPWVLQSVLTLCVINM
jgi:hypothetical protein